MCAWTHSSSQFELEENLEEITHGIQTFFRNVCMADFNPQNKSSKNLEKITQENQNI
jgi:hypothetical protein